MVSSVDVERRHLERHGSAALRAVSGRPTADLRGHRLRLDGTPIPFATPYLSLDANIADAEPDQELSRGISDALGSLLRSCDIELHQQLSPDDIFERIVFDALEQLRCDALTPQRFRGCRENIDAAFEAWSLDARARRVTENRTAMLVFTVTYMARARLMGRTLPEDVDELIESTRGHLGPVVGHALSRLRSTLHDQRAYSIPALEIARLVGELAGDAPEARRRAADTVRQHRLVAPAEWGDGDNDAVEAPLSSMSPSVGGDELDGSLDRLGDYRVYTREHDRTVTATTLFRPEKLTKLRFALDEQARAQAVSAPMLARRLLHVFGQPAEDDWEFGREDGVLDGRRLSQLVASPARHELFKRRRLQLTSDTHITFLIDNSGSMKRQRLQAVAVLIDTYSRALDLAGIAHDVLGFTTRAWTGGRPLSEWRAAGEPPAPGRMNEALHIVYKDADFSWRRSRTSLAALSDSQHFREGLDGEALVWAHRRAMERPEQRKLLILISDGSPTDSATANVNRPGYLDDHLANVADRIERFSPVELGAIGIDLDMSPFVRNSIDLDLTGTLTLQQYRAVFSLFG